MKFSDLRPGDQIEVFKRSKRKGYQSKIATVTQVTDRFIAVDYGEYMGTVSRIEIKIGDYKIKFLKKDEEKDMKGKALNVNREEILEVCRQYGTGQKGFEAIVEKFGMSIHTAKRYVTDLCIRQSLRAEKAEQAEKKQVSENNDLVGHFINEKCPECGSQLLGNEKGQKWCSFVGGKNESACTYGLSELDKRVENAAIQKYLESVGNPPIPKNAEEQYKAFVKMNSPIEIHVGNFIDHPLPIETEEYPVLSGPAETVRESINKSAKVAAEKIIRKGDWIGTFTGKKYWPLDPRPEEVCIEDIAHSLSLTCRFTGHSKRFFSVADHCLNVERYLRDSCSAKVRLYALLHDAAEAYVCDIARPLKRFIPGYNEVEKLNQVNIYRAFDLDSPGDFQEMLIKYADEYMLSVEARELMADTEEWDLMEVYEKPVIREHAEQEFLTVFWTLMDEHAKEASI